MYPGKNIFCVFPIFSEYFCKFYSMLFIFFYILYFVWEVMKNIKTALGNSQIYSLMTRNWERILKYLEENFRRKSEKFFKIFLPELLSQNIRHEFTENKLDGSSIRK